MSKNRITPLLDQSRTTHPATRVIDAARAGEKGSVQPAPQAVPSIADAQSRAQKPERPQIPVPGVDAPAAGSMPMPPANAAKVPHPVTPDVEVKTKH